MGLRHVFAENLVKLRAQRKLSQEELAYEAGIDRTYVSSLERSKYSATLDMVERLAEVLGVEPVQLLKPVSRSR